MFSWGVGGGLPPTSWRDRARWGKPAGLCQGKVNGNPRDTTAVTGLKGESLPVSPVLSGYCHGDPVFTALSGWQPRSNRQMTCPHGNTYLYASTVTLVCTTPPQWKPKIRRATGQVAKQPKS